ncbi:hypothetical protein C8Q74DRAFT_1368328 [Fomes fomentarius]|nr:hypothetical protein C8Q74DRAFT_1368328 [Fomes fomentarius]
MSNIDESPTAATPSGDEGLFANILTPGSSLNPVFLHIVDGVLAILMLIFLALLILTRGSVHFVFLMIVTGCLWASVKWFVVELRNVPVQQSQQNGAAIAKDNSRSKVKDE